MHTHTGIRMLAALQQTVLFNAAYVKHFLSHNRENLAPKIPNVFAKTLRLLDNTVNVEI